MPPLDFLRRLDGPFLRTDPLLDSSIRLAISARFACSLRSCSLIPRLAPPERPLLESPSPLIERLIFLALSSSMMLPFLRFTPSAEYLSTILASYFLPVLP